MFFLPFNHRSWPQSQKEQTETLEKAVGRGQHIVWRGDVETQPGSEFFFWGQQQDGDHWWKEDPQANKTVLVLPTFCGGDGGGWQQDGRLPRSQPSALCLNPDVNSECSTRASRFTHKSFSSGHRAPLCCVHIQRHQFAFPRHGDNAGVTSKVVKHGWKCWLESSFPDPSRFLIHLTPLFSSFLNIRHHEQYHWLFSPHGVLFFLFKPRWNNNWIKKVLWALCLPGTWGW